MQSNEIDKLAEALAKAQGVMAGAKKDSLNPFFKSNYADLASVWEAIRKPLSDNGLSVVQGTEHSSEGLIVTSMLMHESGQWVAGALPVKADKPGLQAIGKEISYARRYLLSAQCGVYQVDLDADDDQGGGKKEDDIKTRQSIQTEKEKKELSGDIPPKNGNGNGGPITPQQATDFRKECSRLKIDPRVAKSMLKEQEINTVDEIPSDRYEEMFKSLDFMASEMAGTA